MPEHSPPATPYLRQKVILIIFSIIMVGLGIGTDEFAFIELMPNVALDFGITGHLTSAYA
jgi:predicted MFS family arabinose efflux permease